MEVYQMRYFASYAKYENISMAAQELHVSQPSVSKAIKALEKELGVSLMRKSGKHCLLTHEGYLLQARILPVLEAIDRFPAEVTGGENSLVIRLNAMSATSLIPEIIRKFRKKRPDVYFNVIDSAESLAWDICIRSSLPEVDFTNSTKLMTENFCAAFRKGHPLEQKEKLTLWDLAEENFIMLKPSSSIRAICEKKFKEIGFVPNISFVTESSYMLKRMVAEGMGVSIWPEHTWKEHIRGDGYPGVTLRPLDIPELSRSIYLIHQHNVKMTGYLEEFSSFCASYFDI